MYRMMSCTSPLTDISCPADMKMGLAGCRRAALDDGQGISLFESWKNAWSSSISVGRFIPLLIGYSSLPLPPKIARVALFVNMRVRVRKASLLVQ